MEIALILIGVVIGHLITMGTLILYHSGKNEVEIEVKEPKWR